MKKALLTVLTAVFVLASTEAGACTTAVIGAGASESGRPMLWKQRDTGNPFNVLVHIPAADGRYAYTAVFNADDLARNAVYAGSNEKGFAIINNMSYNLAKGNYDALNQTYYWTSSERSVASAYYLYASANYFLSLQTYYKSSLFAIRPMIAF